MNYSEKELKGWRKKYANQLRHVNHYVLVEAWCNYINFGSITEKELNVKINYLDQFSRLQQFVVKMIHNQLFGLEAKNLPMHKSTNDILDFIQTNFSLIIEDLESFDRIYFDNCRKIQFYA
jgi:hypothetical protein